MVRRTSFFREGFTDLDAANERSADVDVTRTEMVEAELDTFISRRHEKRVKEEGGERAAEEAWAENRLKESILLRDVMPEHRYPRHQEDLETMRRYHRAYGMPDVGLMARLKRLLTG